LNMSQKIFDDIKLDLPAPRYNGILDFVKLSWKLFLKSFWFVTLTTFPIFACFEIFKRIVIPSENPYADFYFEITFGFLIGTLVPPIVIFGVANYLKTKKFPSVFEAYTFGFGKWFLVFGQNFIIGMFFIFALLLLVFPAFYLVVAYSLIAPVICFESNAGKNLRTRSRELTLGHRGFVFGTLFILFLTSAIVAFIVSFFVFVLFHLTHLTEVGDLFSDCVFDVAQTLTTIGSLLLYLKLRKKHKEQKEVWFLRWAP
jgi:hypothetical protein